MNPAAIEPNYITVLRALANGHAVTMPDGHVYVIQDRKVGVVLKNYNAATDTQEHEFVEATGEINDFIAACDLLKVSYVEELSCLQ